MVSYNHRKDLTVYVQSQIGSRASQRSKGGVAKDSYVDETLFGGKKPATAASGRGNAAVISLDELRTIRQKTEKNN
jgi:hypothetical protein